MEQNTLEQTISFFQYSRKSSEAEDRQVLSIGSQTETMSRVAKGRKINVIDSLIESKSAKRPGREVFNDMISRIKRGEAQGIICWKLDRLARNFKDGGEIIEMLQTGIIKIIVTFEGVYHPWDNVLPIAVEFGVANQFVRDLSVNVKRGLRTKCEMGFPTSLAKIGYINDYGKKGKRQWLPGPEHFHLVKKLLEEYLAGSYSVRNLSDYSNNILGLRTVQRNKEGGKPLHPSQIYTMLKDPFYAGFFYGKDENGQEKRYEANESVPRMITEEQYWLIQTMLGRKGKPCPFKHHDSFPYKTFTKCGFCGGSVTAHHKFQLICPDCKNKFAYNNKTNCPKCGIKIEEMKNPKYLHYIYYNCIKKPTPECRKNVEESVIDDSVSSYLGDNLEISAALRDWCLKHFDELISNNKKDEFEIRASWEKERDQKKKDYDGLKLMRAKDLIDDDEFLSLKEGLKTDIKKAETLLSGLGSTNNDRIQKAKRVFDLTVGIRKTFKKGGFKEKTAALKEVCSNLKLNGKKVDFQEQKEFSIIMSGLLRAKEKNKAFEPTKYEENKDKTEVFASVCPTLLRGQDSNLEPSP